MLYSHDLYIVTYTRDTHVSLDMCIYVFLLLLLFMLHIQLYVYQL